MSDEAIKGPSTFQTLLADPDSPYPIESDIQVGYSLLGRAPYPDITVLDNKIVHVRQLKYQVLMLEASDESQTRVEHVRIGRLVAELEGDAGEVEVQRFLLPTEAEAPPVDTSRCAACLMSIPEDEAIVVDGEAYHQHCYIQNGD
jgi:hypothetical protein